MKERTAWLVTCVAGTSVVLAFYAVFSSHLGGEIVSIVASRKPTQSAGDIRPELASRQRRDPRCRQHRLESRAPVLVGRKASLGRPDPKVRRAIPGYRDRKATADRQDQRVSQDLQVRRERQDFKVRRVSRGLKD